MKPYIKKLYQVIEIEGINNNLGNVLATKETYEEAEQWIDNITELPKTYYEYKMYTIREIYMSYNPNKP